MMSAARLRELIIADGLSFFEWECVIDSSVVVIYTQMDVEQMNEQTMHIA